IIIGIVVVIALISFIHGRVTAKDEVMYILAGNCDSINMSSDVEGTLSDFMEEQGIDPKTQCIAINTNVTYAETGAQPYSLPTLTTLIGAGQVDVALSHGDLFDFMAKNGEFLPIDEIFSKEELEKYQDRLVTGVYEEITYNEDGSEGPINKQNYICGVRIPADQPWLSSTNMYPDTEVVASVIINSEHKDLAKAFLIYLLENE
nr:hypothetical protein [Lachnospiraceae bacterium]